MRWGTATTRKRDFRCPAFHQIETQCWQRCSFCLKRDAQGKFAGEVILMIHWCLLVSQQQSMYHTAVMKILEERRRRFHKRHLHQSPALGPVRRLVCATSSRNFNWMLVPLCDITTLHLSEQNCCLHNVFGHFTFSQGFSHLLCPVVQVSLLKDYHLLKRLIERIT